MEKLKMAHYGEARDVEASNPEARIFDILQSMTDEELQLVRKSDSYVTAMLGDWDLARFKFTERAKWINFPIVQKGSDKNRIEDPEDVRGFEQQIADSIEHILKYS